MGAERLLRDFNIPHVTEGHQHSTAGWVNVHCPFCAGSREYHLGIQEELKACHCWRCGSHPVLPTLSRILSVPVPEVKQILNKYQYRGAATRKPLAPEAKVSIHPFKFPQPHFSLDGRGKRYLSKRGFDPDYLEREWGLLQTGPVSFLDKIAYGNRILIPINWGGKVVSFQSRDITERSDRKYLACPMRRETIHHKNILYGKPECWGEFKSIIIVEGVTDVWRFGPRAVATFGIEFKTEQVRQLKSLGERFFIVFDNEPQAQGQARLLAAKLRAFRKEVYIETVESDPGGMKQDDASHFVREMIKK